MADNKIVNSCENAGIISSLRSRLVLQDNHCACQEDVLFTDKKVTAQHKEGRKGKFYLPLNNLLH